MKKFLTIFVSMLLLFCLAACSSKSKDPLSDDAEASVSPVEEAEPEDTPEPEVPQASESESSSAIKEESTPKEAPLLPYGLWWAVGEEGDAYYELRDNGTGSFVQQYDGAAEILIYECEASSSTEGRLILHYIEREGDAAEGTMQVQVQDDGLATVTWENGATETWTYLGDQTLFDFAFYSTEDLMSMAQAYYGATSEDGSIPEYVAAEIDENGMIVIQLYDALDGHNSTADWYTVDRFTAIGTNILGEEINLTAVPVG